MPVIESKGGLSSQGFGEFAKTGGLATYIEDVFSTYLYTGNGYAQSIPNGIALGTAYGGSGYFYPANGSRLYWSFPSTPVQNAVAGTNYTIEFWVYRLPRVNTYQCIFSTENDRNNFIIDASDNLIVKSNGGTTMFTLAANTYIPTYTWTYVALVCSGTTWTLYFNGTSYGTYNGASKTSYATGTAQLGGRNDMDGCGYLSNFRVSTVARYSSNFTPSTIPFTSDASTAMLTLTGSSPFTDISSNAQSMTQAGSIYAQVGYGPFTSATPAKGGMVWLKDRSSAGTQNVLYDTSRGVRQTLGSNLSSGQQTDNPGYGLLSFNSTGFTLGPDWSANVNTSPDYFTSWSFAEQPKFFDVVTYTGNGANRTVSHSLGSVPGCIIIKRTDTTGAWAVYHRSLANTEYLVLNTTAAKATGATYWNSTTPTSTVFSLGTDATVNASGGTYVAYLFAHDAGGFGLTGTDNVISCGSVGSNPTTVNLGWEPQWLLIKPTGSPSDWYLMDNMRGIFVDSSGQGYVNVLTPNGSSAELAGNYIAGINSTGFTWTFTSPAIYIAIRRGPMKTPTSGTSVFLPYLGAGTFNVGFPPDFDISASSDSVGNKFAVSRLTGSNYMLTNLTNAEAAGTVVWNGATNTWSQSNVSSAVINWLWRRAPGFFDEVCYTGTGANTTKTHNLGVAPELIIVKRRDTTGAWDTYSAALSNTEYLVVNTTDAKATGATRWNSTTPTSTVFSLGTSTTTNASGGTYVAYLFATCAGVSKVGSYTGNGSSQTINCGFTGGSRFVLIKRTDSNGNWTVWDSARGIVAGNDSRINLNDTADAKLTDDTVDTDASGFIVNQTATTNMNVSSGTYIFLAIA